MSGNEYENSIPSPPGAAIGSDIVDVRRFARPLERERFRTLLFTERERLYCESRPSPLESFAARFAAKEAFSKALGTGLFREHLTPKDIEVLASPDGPPGLRLTQRAQTLMHDRGFHHAALSLSHDTGYASATVLLTERALAPRVSPRS